MTSERSIEQIDRDLYWAKHVLSQSREPIQRERMRQRIETLEAEKAAAK